MQIIENSNLRVSITEVGSLLTSVYDKNLKQELLWQKDPAIWNSQDVLIFPIIGPATTSFNNKEVTMRQHGFTRESLFTVISNDGENLILSLKYSDDTLKVYPYEFELRVHYSLQDYTLSYFIEVINFSSTPLPYMLGMHCAFLIKNGAYVETHANKYFERINNVVLDEKDWKESANLLLTKPLFQKYDTIILENDLPSNWILHTNKGYKLIYKINSPLVAIWSNPTKGDYVCIEPWWGLPVYQDMPKNFLERKYVNFAKTIDTYNFSITFEKE